MSLRLLFTVQGEGRGHLTQALAAAEILSARGHVVVAALVGRSPARLAPAFFEERLGAPVAYVDSPNFEYHPTTRAVSLSRTIAGGLRQPGTLLAAIARIDREIAAQRPDVIVNFYEGMMGLHASRARPRVPIVAVAHQYMFMHPRYRFAAGQPASRAATMAYTRLTASGAAARLALSLYPAPDIPRWRLRVVPPLLRRDLFEHAAARPVEPPFLLAYLLHRHLASRLERWHEHNRERRVHCFWDGPPLAPHPNLTFHALDGERFLTMMAAASGVVCTAGFESVSEAMWLGRPVFMMPTPGHLEQRTNAIDASGAGAGIFGDELELDRFLEYLPRHVPRTGAFRSWVAQAEPALVAAVEAAAAPEALRRRRVATPWAGRERTALGLGAPAG